MKQQTIQTSVEKQPAQVEHVTQGTRKGVSWPELKFPPINLWSVWPTEAACHIHAETQDVTLWDSYD